MSSDYILVLSTCPDELSARVLAGQLVTERLAACVMRVPGARSSYVWNGVMQDSPEVLLVFKTTAGRLATLSARIEALHPYDVPEVVAIGIDSGSERYRAWLGQTLA